MGNKNNGEVLLNHLTLIKIKKKQKDKHLDWNRPLERIEITEQRKHWTIKEILQFTKNERYINDLYSLFCLGGGQIRGEWV